MSKKIKLEAYEIKKFNRKCMEPLEERCRRMWEYVYCNKKKKLMAITNFNGVEIRMNYEGENHD